MIFSLCININSINPFDLLPMGPAVVAIFGTIVYKFAAAIVARLIVAILLTAGITAGTSSSSSSSFLDLVCFLCLVATGYSWFLISIPKMNKIKGLHCMHF